MKLFSLGRIFLTFSFLLLCISTSKAKQTLNFENEIKSENMTVLEKWKQLEIDIKAMASKAVKEVLPYLMEYQSKVNISSQCIREGMYLLNGVKNIKAWAVRFIDASAKTIDGTMVGSMSSFGAFDECINTVVPGKKSRDKGKILFQGQYCTIDIRPPLPPVKSFYKLEEILDDFKNFSKGDTVLSEASKIAHFFYFLSLRMGICVPSGCSLEDINQLASKLGASLYLDAHASRCEIKQENDFTPLRIFTMFAYSFAGLLMLIGSVIDIYCYYTKATFKGTGVRVLLCFSFMTNFKKFVNTKTSSDTLSCLNGIRFLCMSWIILGHTYLIMNFQIFLGLEKAREYAKDFAFQAVINASVAVDTFFCIGGMLVCYVTIKLVKIQGRPFNITVYIFHRLWRIIPVYAYVILFMTLSELAGSGPIWHDTTHKYLKACENNWWTNLLFINNFYHSTDMCIPQSWYIACDFQMYVAAILILIPLLRWPKVGLSMCGAVIASSVLYCGIGTYVNNYPPTMLFAHPDPEERTRFWAAYYFKPFVHASPYCIGLITGYILATKPNLKMSKITLMVGWGLAFISNFSVLYGVVDWNRGRDPYLLEGLLYASLNRTAWTFGVAWMIVCCATGYGGVINYILSWKCFIPLGRLTFIVYLIHPIVQIVSVGNVRTQIQPDHFFAVWIFFGHLCITYGSAFAGTMLVEAPFLALEKIFFERAQREDRSRKASILNGTLKSGKIGDIAAIVPTEIESSKGIDNFAVVSKL